MLYCQGCKVLSRGGHNYLRISTFPFQTKIYGGVGSKKRDEDLDIYVEDDVWIGYDTIVLAGARIGKGSIVGARAVVTGTIPPYSVYVGNKVIKKRFPEEIINKISHIEFSKITHFKGDKYEEWCTKEVTPSNVDKILKSFENIE